MARKATKFSKPKEVGAVSKMEFPELIRLQLAVTDGIKSNFLPGALIVLAALVLVEWRWQGWSRYRRRLFDIAAFDLNFSAFCFPASRLVYAVVAASNSAHPH